MSACGCVQGEDEVVSLASSIAEASCRLFSMEVFSRERTCAVEPRVRQRN